MGHRPIRYMAAAIIAVGVCVALLAPGIARAADIPANGAHEAIAATYSGWAYVLTDQAPTASAWKWKAGGWDAATFPVGKSVWVAPWGSGWTWVWADGAWYAMQTTQLAKWSCEGLTGDQAVFPKTAGGSLTIRRYNSDLAAVAGTTGKFDRVTISCANGFRDAADTTTIFALVRVQNYKYCMPFTLDCIMAPVAGTSYTGYVSIKAIGDMLVRPPEGTFGQLPGEPAAAGAAAAPAAADEPAAGEAGAGAAAVADNA